MWNSAEFKPLLLCPGEPAGIGPDLVLALAARNALPPEILVIADPDLLEQRSQQLSLKVPITVVGDKLRRQPGVLQVLPVATRTDVTPGQLNPDNAAYVLACLDLALELCLADKAAALITGPAHKGIINDAGIPFSGHTEYLAEAAGAPTPVMMLATPGLRIALATTHLPLAAVPAAITTSALERILEILDRDMQRWFTDERPRIYVTGLNPHAGEGGHMGREEIDEIIPAIESARRRGMQITGPLPADTAFTSQMREQADVFLAMYHDQGLPVLKYAGFGQAVNVTLGLPFIRTSVDHGAGLDLAGTGRANAGSLAYAIDVAQGMMSKR